MPDCIAPDEVSDWQLEMFADGWPDPHVNGHLARCPACQARVVELRQADRHLADALFRHTCPPVDDLLNFHYGLLSARQEPTLLTHLARCPYCTWELNFIRAGGTRLPVDRPAALQERLRYLVARLLPATPGLAPQRNSGAAAAPSERNAPPADLYFQVDELDWELVLHWTAVPGAAYALEAQIFGPPPTMLQALSAALIAEEDSVPFLQEAGIAPDGVFTLEPIPAGRYVLRLVSPDHIVDFPHLQPG